MPDIFQQMAIVNNPVRPGKAVNILHQTQADAHYIALLVLDSVDTQGVGLNLNYTFDIYEGNQTQIETCITAPVTLGDHFLLFCVFADESCTDPIETHIVPFRVEQYDYAVEFEEDTNYQCDMIGYAGGLKLYDARGTYPENAVIEMPFSWFFVARDGVDCTSAINYNMTCDNFTGSTPCRLELCISSAWPGPGIYTFRLQVLVTDGWPADWGGESKTLLYEHELPPLVVE